jgi:hypothetical protein
MKASSLIIILTTFITHLWRPAHPQVRNRYSHSNFESEYVGFSENKSWWHNKALAPWLNLSCTEKDDSNPCIQGCQPDFKLGVLANQCYSNECQLDWALRRDTRSIKVNLSSWYAVFIYWLIYSVWLMFSVKSYQQFCKLQHFSDTHT